MLIAPGGENGEEKVENLCVFFHRRLSATLKDN